MNYVKPQQLLNIMMFILLPSSLLSTILLVGLPNIKITVESRDGVTALSRNSITEINKELSNVYVDSMIHAPSTEAENVEYVGHIGGSTIAVSVQGDYAYIGQGSHLAILDITNPASPTLIGKTASFPNIVQDIYVDGKYAYVTTLYSGLRVVDISTPSSPSEIGYYDTPGLARGIALMGDYALIADGYDSGVRVLNISNPTSLSEVGFYDTPGDPRGITVFENHAYIADGSSGLRIVDFTNPSTPNELGFYDTPNYAYRVVLSGIHAYVADWDGGLRVIDISFSTNPHEVG